jgi:hypothetical protein
MYIYVHIYIYAYMCVEKLKHIFTKTCDHLLVKALSALAARPSTLPGSQGPRPWQVKALGLGSQDICRGEL